MPSHSLLDQFIIHADQALRTMLAPASAAAPSPARGMPEPELSAPERAHAAALMRVNHAGEVAAQALYHGQALTARSERVRAQMLTAAQEEGAHLAWSEARIRELGGRTSVANPFWYAGAFAMGAFAGRLGDKWNLGFVMETERQVERHLDGHLQQLPVADTKSRAIVEKMNADEVRHGREAERLGGAELPLPVRLAMSATSKLMTRGAYYA